MKRFIIALGLFLFLITGCSKREESVKLLPNSPVYLFAQNTAKVFPFLDPDSNNTIVKTSRFSISTALVFNRVNANFGNDISQLASLDSERLKMIVDQTAENLAQQKILLKKADKAGIKITVTSIDSVMDEQYKRSGGEQEYLSFIQGNGLDLDYVKNEIKSNLLTQRYIKRRIGNTIDIADEEIIEEYQKEKTATVRHILKSAGDTKAEKDKAKIEIEKILVRVRKGEDFGKLAKQFSEDPGTKKNGGLLENFKRGQMVPEFDKVSFSLPVGKISNPVGTQFGYHIIKVIERKSEERPLEEVRGKIVSMLQEQKHRNAFDELWEELKQEVEYQIAEY
jgi:foldase protein PrsA